MRPAARVDDLQVLVDSVGAPGDARRVRLLFADSSACDLPALLETAQLPQLESLVLMDCEVTDAMLARVAPALGRFPRLATLGLAGNQVTDAGLAHLASAARAGRLDALVELHLVRNRVTAVPEELLALPRLRLLNVALGNRGLRFPPPAVIRRGVPRALAFAQRWALVRARHGQPAVAGPLQEFVKRAPARVVREIGEWL